MRNKTFVTGAIIIVVVLVVAGVLLAMRKSDNTDYNSSSNMSSMPSDSSSSSDTPTNTTPSDQNTVAIKDYAYGPTSITVKVGTKVTWTNEDSVGHTVTADTTSSDAPASNTFGKGESYSFTFNKAGTYTYHCMPHPYMKGTVVVTE